MLQVEMDSAALVYDLQEKPAQIKRNMKPALRSSLNVLRAAARKAATHPFFRDRRGYKLRVRVSGELEGRGTISASGPGKYIAEGHGPMLAPMTAKLRTWLQNHGYTVSAKSTSVRLKAQTPAPWVPSAESALDSAQRAFEQTLLEERGRLR